MMRNRILPLAAGLAMAFALTLGAGQALAAGDAAKGEKVFKKCKACHSIAAGKNKVGPSLAGVVGRKAGSAAKYKYSKSMKAAGEKGLVWDEASIAEFIGNPSKFLKEYLGDKKARSKMALKLRKQADRDNVISYLKTK